MQNLHSVPAVWKHRKRIILLAGVLLAAGLIWAASSRRLVEPTYRGQLLTHYISAHITATYDMRTPELRPLAELNRDRAAQAVREIGTNAIPILLLWISYEPSVLKTYYLQTLDRLQNTPLRNWFPSAYDYAKARTYTADIGFSILGAEAKPAAPALARLAQDFRKPLAAENAARALYSIGPAALPALLAVATNAPPRARGWALRGFAGLTNNLPAVLPALFHCLEDKDRQFAGISADALCFLVSRQGVVPPALTNILNDPRPRIRSAALSAICGLDPLPDAALPMVTAALKDPASEVRSATIVSLKRFPDAALPFITNALGDPDLIVRRVATNALHRIPP